MYAQKYDEEFAPHLPVFVTAVWNLLINTGQQVKYDLVRSPMRGIVTVNFGLSIEWFSF